MPRERTYFVSDVHLGLDVKDAAGRERRFIRFLRSIPAAETGALYLLGDIWDFWYEYRDVVPKGYVGVFAALQELMAAGVKVYFLRGNHDIWSYRYFEELGMVRLEQPHVTRIGGLTLCLGHGDGLGPVPRRYHFIRSLFHNRVCQALFSALHPWIAFRLGEGWSRRSRLARAGAYVFQGGRRHFRSRWTCLFSGIIIAASMRSCPPARVSCCWATGWTLRLSPACRQGICSSPSCHDASFPA